MSCDEKVMSIILCHYAACTLILPHMVARAHRIYEA